MFFKFIFLLVMPKYEGKPNFSFLKPPRPKNRKKSVKRMASFASAATTGRARKLPGPKHQGGGLGDPFFLHFLNIGFKETVLPKTSLLRTLEVP